MNSCSFPLTTARLQELDRLQRRMLRRIVRWRRDTSELWKNTIRRMKDRLHRAQQLHQCRPWSECYARAQWRFVGHIIDRDISLWSRILCKFNWTPHYDDTIPTLPQRHPGRPRRKWDDYIYAFCAQKWPRSRDLHWFDVLIHHTPSYYEDAFVIFMRTAIVS